MIPLLWVLVVWVVGAMSTVYYFSPTGGKNKCQRKEKKMNETPTAEENKKNENGNDNRRPSDSYRATCSKCCGTCKHIGKFVGDPIEIACLLDRGLMEISVFGLCDLYDQYNSEDDDSMMDAAAPQVHDEVVNQ